MKKKIRCIIFLFFQLLEINEKIIIIIMKKKICAEPFLGYCSNYIVKIKIFVLQERHCIVR